MAAKKKGAPKKKATKKASKKVDSVNLEDIITNWNKMNEHLNDLKEEQCLKLLHMEQDGKRRVHMLNRIHARFTKLRSERERIEIMQGKKIAA